MKIRILTDSACDLAAEDLDKYGIDVMPLYILEGEKTLRDGIDITPEILYENMKKGVYYKTSQIPYNDFFSRFSAIAEAGDACLCLPFSSGLSGTYQTAVLACRDVLEKYPDARIEVIDTKAVTVGLGLIVERVGKAAIEGASFDELKTIAEFYSTHMHGVFTVGDLEYLYRGGRLNKGTAVIGNMLKLKPLLIVDENGELKQLEIERGEKKLLKRMLEYIDKTGKDLDKQVIAVTHAADPELADKFISLASKHYRTDNFRVLPLAAIIGTHTGPGTLGVFYFDAQMA